MSRPYLWKDSGSALSFVEAKSILLEVQGLSPSIDGIHQINDANRLSDVINLAKVEWEGDLALKLAAAQPFITGKALKFKVVSGHVVGLEFGWMTAARRIALGLPLTVDQMTQEDWSDLKGVGASLALKIEADRQVNGDFGKLSNLLRVKGIGKKRLKNLESYFHCPK